MNDAGLINCRPRWVRANASETHVTAYRPGSQIGVGRDWCHSELPSADPVAGTQRDV